MSMELLTAIDGTLVPISQIMEIRQRDGHFIVSTRLRSYKVSNEEALKLRKPPRATRKKVQA